MKAKLYILTYNSEYHLNEGLRTLFAGDLSKHELEVYIINNHTNIHVQDSYINRVTVLHNVLQPDFGTGHTSRNWNQALIHGFKDLNNPDCDLVICAQDDTIYMPDWLNTLHKIHFEMAYDFFCVGAGDMLHSYTPRAVKKVGLWDERFAAICFMEHDYFIRAAMHLGDAATVNDTGHAAGLYSFNQIGEAHDVAYNPQRTDQKIQLGQARAKFDNPFRELFKAKWGNYSEYTPTTMFLNTTRLPGIINYVLYPYFEKDIEDLNGLGYNLGSGWNRP